MLSAKHHKSLGIAFLLVILTVVGVGCSKEPTAKSADQGLKITTTTDFYGEVARAVVGKKGTVTSIINQPNVDPHDYDPTPKTAKTVAGSQLVIANGLGYDSWMNNLVKTNDSQAKYLKVGENVAGKKSGDNPHVWYDPQTMPKLARKIAQVLGKKQPKDRAYFEKNAQKYIDSLQPMQDKVAALKKVAQQTNNKNVYVSEPVFDYSIKSMGFRVGDQEFENAVEKGTDPSPQTISAMQNKIKQGKIAFFVYNSQVSDKTVNNFVTLAKKNQVPVLKVTETLPAKKNYQEWMTGQYDQLLKILEQGH
ncbi:ABC transporter substrate-binding protein [Ligilactobacillus pabuli]|uniref:ABC transporter substrate-binding protein n=1 Tax=Ligilactobacillus pabuli TaxID=2886039 RepID=A0ABQ5JGK0_9LACO|nr:zinc ABC transporter substrate-binding protein [Ligilactobacillus pabuli]GKS81203.1 ABC transporter substrate-binding protein [Ligilactobacillus pabuli]HIW88562.1 zinc ABC transporter substrate-binding protein [Candidatus Ligilactobacillus excrementipullorum]